MADNTLFKIQHGEIVCDECGCKLQYAANEYTKITADHLVHVYGWQYNSKVPPQFQKILCPFCRLVRILTQGKNRMLIEPDSWVADILKRYGDV